MAPLPTLPVSPRPRKTIGPRSLQIMQTLHQHPLLSRRQIELTCGVSARKAQAHLAALRHPGWVTEYNTRQPSLYARAVYALTPTGYEQLAAQTQASPPMAATRLAHLIVRMERVFKTRNLFLWLAQSPAQDWELARWDVEVEFHFQVQDKSVRIPFHGAAQVKRPNGRWLTVLVEFDTGRVPVLNLGERMRAFIEAQRDPRYAYSRTVEFPTLLIVAADPARLQEYYTFLFTYARARQLPLPSVYLAVAAEALRMREDHHAPIWYAMELGKRTVLFLNAAGNTVALPASPHWQPIASNGLGGTEDGTIQPLGLTSPVGRGVVQFAALSLALEPLAKQVLDEVARHPLLTTHELALVLQTTPWYLEKILRQVARWKLVEAYCFTASNRLVPEVSEPGGSGTPNPVVHYLIAKTGMRYLAAVAGFDQHLTQYARARGWGKGLDALVKYYAHTRQENTVFLQLAQIAERRGHTLRWLAELESRLYYALHDRRHSFLPDGRGTYRAGARRYEFTVEIDRSRSSRKKLRRKLNEYIACLLANVLRGEQVEALRILFVTQSWERAETVWRTALALARENHAEQVLELYITTFDRLQASGADGAIWLTLQSDRANHPRTVVPKTYCFDCFAPQAGESITQSVWEARRTR